MKKQLQTKTQKSQKKQNKTKQLLVSPLVNSIWPYIIVSAFAFLLYANSIPNEYAFDDSIVITENNFIKQGIKSIPDIMTTDFLTGMWGRQMKMYDGGRYRPLSLVTFAIEYEFFGKNPHISHFINALLYAFTAFLLYIVLQKLFAKHLWQFPKNFEWYVSLPFVITLLYIAHPLHTEAVANIKGRDEIMAFLGMLGAWWFAIKYIETEKARQLLYSALMLMFGMLSKESAITFLAVVPLSIFVFTDTDRRKLMWITGVLLVSSLIFLRIRGAVLGGLPDNDIPPTLLTDSFVGMSAVQRYATTFYTFLIYLKLLFFPHPLTYDYYPYYVPIKTFADWEVWASILLMIGLGIYSVVKLKAKSIFGFGVLFFWITFSVYSNLLFSIGVFMSERFVYAPSLGFIIALVGASVFIGEKILKTEKATKIIVAGFALMIIGFSVKTVSRNFAWKNSFTLFTTDVKVSGKKSFKSTAGAGELLLFKARKTKNATERNLYYDNAIKYFSVTLDVFPTYIYVIQYMGDAYLERHRDYKTALDYYAKVFQYRPDYTDTYKRIERFFKLSPINLIDADFRIAYWERIKKISPECAERFEVNASLGRLYGAYRNDLPLALTYLKKAEKINPNDVDLLTDLGVAYSLSKQFALASSSLEKATRLQPNNKQAWSNLSAVYNALGEKAKANKARQRAADIK